MEEYDVKIGVDKKCPAIPPIVIHSSAPCPAPNNSGGSFILPPISPQASVLSGGYQAHWNTNSHKMQLSSEDQVKNEQINSVQPYSCMPSQSNHIGKNISNSNLHLLNQHHFPNLLSPLATNGAGIQHLHPPHVNPYAASSELSPTHKSDPARGLLHYDSQRPAGRKGKLKLEPRPGPGTHKLPPLKSYTSGNNLDVDDTLSPLVPPINSISPYIGSGISEIPSFPSILASPVQLSRKRTLSTSPLSDMFDVYTLRSSPNSLMATLSNPMTPSGNSGTVGHLLGQANPPVHTMQYRVQQRKTSIEHNQNDDGTTNTTITNQITISKNPQTRQDTNPDTQANQSGMEAEAMELGTFNGHSNNTSSNYRQESRDEEPHICLWEGCGLSFGDLDDLVLHIENAHIEKGKADEYICLWQSCIRGQKPFNARYKLLIHMRIHSGEKPNKCTYVGCTKAFSRLENLKIHLRTHTGEKPYICQFSGCQKSFSNSSDRSKHQKTHFERKPYACTHPECSKRYTDPSSLRKHIKMHSLRKKPRSDSSNEETLGGCLTIQPLQCGEPQKPTNSKIGLSKLPKLNSLKSERVADITSVRRTTHDETSVNPAQSIGQFYPSLSSNGPTSPGIMMASPLSDQCSPSVIHSHTCHHNYEQVPQRPTLPQTMNRCLPPYTSALSPSSNLYTADPASPMQTAYPHMTANSFPLERANPMTVQSVPPHPPPNYTEATTGGPYTHLPPNYDSVMTGNGYPPHFTAALPTTNS